MLHGLTWLLQRYADCLRGYEAKSGRFDGTSLAPGFALGPHGPEPCNLGNGLKIAKYNLIASQILYNHGFPARTAVFEII